MKNNKPLILKCILAIFSIWIFAIPANCQDPSAIFELESTTQGVLIPRMTQAERTAIVNPAPGLQVYDTDSNSFWYFDEKWIPLISGTTNKKIVKSVGQDFPPNFLDTISMDLSGTFDAPSEIRVCVNVTHSWIGDVQLYLKSPNGSTIALSTNNGGSDSNYTNTCFTSNATTPITSGSAPFNGDYLPEGSWSTLYGTPNSGGMGFRCSRYPR